MHTVSPRNNPVGALSASGMPRMAQLRTPMVKPTPAPIPSGFCITLGRRGGAFLGLERSMLTFERLSFSVAIMD